MTARGRLRVILAVAVVAVAATSCRMDATVHVEVEPQGSGIVTVTLEADAAAVALVPSLRDGLLIEDIRDAQWVLEGPARRGDDGVEIRAFKRFAAASELALVLDELAGPSTFFSDVRLLQRHTFGKTEYAFRASVDPSPPLEAFSDGALAAALDGHPFGRPTTDLLAATGSPQDALGLVFSFTLRDDEAELDAATADVDGTTATWRFAYGDSAEVVTMSAIREHRGPPLWMNAARAAAAAFVLVVVLTLVVWLIKFWRTPKGRRRAARRRKQRIAAREAEASRPRKRLLRLLVVDVHGVLVRPTVPLESLLLPVIQSELPDVDVDLVADRYRKLVLGRLAPDEFWSDLGLGPIGTQIETRYLSSYRLVPGLHSFLDRVRDRGLPVAAVGNQPREWGDRLRRMAQLEDSMASWLVSGEVGAVLPEPPLFEATRRVMSVDLYDCLYLSSVPEYLDAAAKMGMATAYFAASPQDMLETDHTIVRGFDDLLRGRSASS